MRTVDMNQPIRLPDGEFHIVESRGSIVRLRGGANDSVVDMHLSELARHAPAAALSRSPRVMDAISPARRADVQFWGEHIREVLTGAKHLGEEDVNPDYDPTCHSLNTRVLLKVRDLQAAGTPTSRATLMRKIKAFREGGPVDLIDGRALRGHEPLANLDPRIKDVLFGVIADQLHRSTGTQLRTIQETQRLLLDEYGHEAPAMPSRATMYRYLAVLTKDKHTFGSARTRRSLGERPDRTSRKNVQTLPGAEVQVDSTPLDIFVRLTDGSVTRPTVSIMVDVATRSIMAASVRLRATKSIDHVVLLAQALTPDQNRPDRTAQRALVQAANPMAELASDEERQELESSRPFIYPRRLMMDNGADYRGSTFMAALEKFGIDVTLSPPHTPTAKSIVERTWRSINTLFCQHLPGYAAGGVEFRGLRITEGELLTPEALSELLDDWILRTWQNRPHEGLRDPYEPSIRYSPNQMLSAAAAITSTLVLPITRDDYIDLLPTEWRNISHVGIRLGNREYDSEELHPLRGTRSARADQDGKWEVKSDPYNPYYVWVRSPTGGWIQCIDRNHAYLQQPFYENLRPEHIETERERIARDDSERHGVPMHLALPIQTVPDLVIDDSDDALIDIQPFNPED